MIVLIIMVNISITINDSILEYIDKVAEDLQETRSMAIRHIIREFKKLQVLADKVEEKS